MSAPSNHTPSKIALRLGVIAQVADAYLHEDYGKELRSIANSYDALLAALMRAESAIRAAEGAEHV